MIVADRRCRVCGAADAACGTHSNTPPVDDGWQEVAEVDGGELKTYEVDVRGNKTTMQLNEHDAKRYGVLPGSESDDTETAGVNAEGSDGADESAPDAGEAGDDALITSAKARGTSNKARTAANNK